MSDLAARSIEIILKTQAASGAYPACPVFPTYHYSWFRDGSFIAYAMDLVGEHDSARRFHLWAATAITKRADIVERAVARTRSGHRLEQRELLHTRYALDGELADEGDDWPNFQLDGFGTWLWAAGEHASRTGSTRNGSLQTACQLTADYLKALWRLPCYDCWEEFPEQVHPYTLAAIAAGLRAHQDLARADHERELRAIRELLDDAVVEGAFVKSLGRNDVDASLIGLATPYHSVEPDDPRMQTTVARVERDLIGGGGVHRYSKDTYYGGGEWVLLAAWLAWHYRQLGRNDDAEAMLRWVEQQADEEGQLPEQVPANLNDPSYYPIWIKRWGPVAKPLLWSHAMYLIARTG